MGLSVSIKKKVNGFILDARWEIGDELAVLFGYSGSGKSLTLQLIAGLMKPNHGSIGLNGKTLFDSESGSNLAPQERSFGYVIQNLALFPHMTVHENILYGAHGLSRTERDQRAGVIIDRFQLAGLEKKYPAEISGGQKQRVALARALIRRPAALLLDEPFSALDNPLRVEMQNFLKEIHREFPIPIVFVTHDVFEAFAIADKIIVYVNGKIAQIGTPAEVFTRPANSDVELLVRTRNRLLQSVESAQYDATYE
ncbi:MAG TPA: ATP-binding cassette domain-containing protein [Nitrospirota bacterium]|nr:ATP-binding cassette domain-containing protein [Nitrospirota bacterium]